MAGRSRILLARRTWWIVFALAIALPALVLALVGLRAMRLEERERSAELDRQHEQASRLIDAALLPLFDRVLLDWTTRDDPARPDLVVPFELSGDNAVKLPAAKIVSPPPGAEPSVSLERPRPASAMVLRAQAAHARHRLSEALLSYATVAGDPALQPWADLQRSRARYELGDRAALPALADPTWAQLDARSPDGVPVAMLAASCVETVEPRDRPRFLPLLRDVERALHTGRWWLTLPARRAYGTELRRWLAAAGGEPPAVDANAESAARLLPALRRLRHGPAEPRAVFAPGVDPLLVIRASAADGGDRRGLVVARDALATLLNAALLPMRQHWTTTALHDEAGALVWGEPDDTPAPQARPLSAVAGLRVSVQDPSHAPDAIRWRRARNYALVIVPLLVLASGLVMTIWIARRELALAREQSQFVASVTHEFKSPLTGIRLLTERLGGSSDGSTGRYSAAIGAETARLEGLVNRLLEAQQLQNRQRAYRFQSRSIAAIAETVVARMQPQAESRGIRLSLEPHHAIPEVLLDAEAIADALGNLIDNAIKYSDPHTRIDVSLAASDGGLSVTIADEGCGIDPADADRIFEPFYRGRRGDERSVHGTGLGLALVRATAEAHGGSVAVQPNPPRGSRFTLWLPKARDARVDA
jgi:signal transduction histidine kinase